MIGDSKLLTSAAWDAQSLNELKAKAGQDPAANIRPVARQVEGMFVQMMLKSMLEMKILQKLIKKQLLT